MGFTAGMAFCKKGAHGADGISCQFRRSASFSPCWIHAASRYFVGYVVGGSSGSQMSGVAAPRYVARMQHIFGPLARGNKMRNSMCAEFSPSLFWLHANHYYAISVIVPAQPRPTFRRSATGYAIPKALDAVDGENRGCRVRRSHSILLSRVACLGSRTLPGVRDPRSLYSAMRA